MSERFVPRGYRPPEGLTTDRFRIRPITVHDTVKDLEAVMSSRDYLWSRFGKDWGWPPADLSLEQDLIDLAWHQKEAQLNSSYNYAVMSPDGDRLLGCVYLDPPSSFEADVEICWWIRTGPDQQELERLLGQAVRQWVREAWVFERPSYLEFPPS